MAKAVTKKKSPKSNKKEVKAEILGKLTDALQEYQTPGTKKKLTKKLKKASRSITPLVVKSKQEKAKSAGNKSE